MKLNFRGFRLAQRLILTGGRADTSHLTCRAYQKDADLCGAAATWLLTAACAHEHIVPSLGCDDHAAQARDLEERGQVICTPCNTGPRPHSCPVVIEYTALPVLT